MAENIAGEHSRIPTAPNANSSLQHEAPPCVVAILNVLCPAFQEIVRGIKVSTDATLAELLLQLTSQTELTRCRDALREASAATTTSSHSSSSDLESLNNYRLCGIVDATLHPPRPICGSSDAYPMTITAALLRTVHQLGLWPSATIDLYLEKLTDAFPSASPEVAIDSLPDNMCSVCPAARKAESIGLNGDEHLALGDITWTVVVKPVHSPADRVTVKYLKPSDSVHVLKCRVAVQRPDSLAPASSLVAVHDGRVLKDYLSVAASGLKDGSVLVVLKQASKNFEETSRRTEPVILSGGITSSLLRNQRDAPLTAHAAHMDNSTPAAPAMDADLTAEGVAAAETEAAAVDHDEDSSHEPSCRICHGGSEVVHELGRLLAPCRCRGTMRLVHLHCLNQWRQLAPSPQSAVACDQCGYVYQFERTKLAELLLSSKGAFVVGLVTFLVVLYAASSAVHMCVPNAWKAAFWMRAWRPTMPPYFRLGNRMIANAWEWPQTWSCLQGHLDFLAGGAYLFGAGGFLSYLAVEVQYARLNRAIFLGQQQVHRGGGPPPWWSGWLTMHSAMFVVWLMHLATAQGQGPWKLILVIGLSALGKDAAFAAHALAQRTASWLGERMLEVQ